MHEVIGTKLPLMAGFDKSGEELFKSCQTCTVVKSAPSTAPLHPWVWPEPTWQRNNIVFIGPFNGQVLLLLVNARSKWPEIHEMLSMTIDLIIAVCVCSLWIARTNCIGQRPQFASQEFADILHSNGITHAQTATLHPTGQWKDLSKTSSMQ